MPAQLDGCESVRRACAVVIGCFAFVCIYFVGFYPGPFDANQRSHYQLLRALGERGTAEIGPELRDLGTHPDVAAYRGRKYSNKAPGLSVAALPGYRLLRLFAPEPRSSKDWLVFYGARVLSVTLVVLLALRMFVRLALSVMPVPRLLPLWLFALLFATPFAVYSRSFFSHALTAGLSFLSFALLAGPGGIATALAAGFLAGAAVASEYPAAVIAVCLLVFAASARSPARLAAFIAGAFVPAVALGWYHTHYFGGLLHVPPAFSLNFATEAERGIVGVSWPRAESLAGLFVDSAHGLLYFSPFLLLWPVVAVLALRRVRREPSLLPPALGPLLLLLVIAGYVPPHWRGGWCLGPRYLMAGFLLVFWLMTVRVPACGGRIVPVVLLAAIVYAAAIVTISRFHLLDDSVRRVEPRADRRGTLPLSRHRRLQSGRGRRAAAPAFDRSADRGRRHRSRRGARRVRGSEARGGRGGSRRPPGGRGDPVSPALAGGCRRTATAKRSRRFSDRPCGSAGASPARQLFRRFEGLVAEGVLLRALHDVEAVAGGLVAGIAAFGQRVVRLREGAQDPSSRSPRRGARGAPSRSSRSPDRSGPASPSAWDGGARCRRTPPSTRPARRRRAPSSAPLPQTRAWRAASAGKP